MQNVELGCRLLNKGKVDDVGKHKHMWRKHKHKYTCNKWKKTQTHAEGRAGLLAVKGKVDEGDKHEHLWKERKHKHM